MYTWLRGASMTAEPFSTRTKPEKQRDGETGFLKGFYRGKFKGVSKNIIRRNCVNPPLTRKGEGKGRALRLTI